MERFKDVYAAGDKLLKEYVNMEMQPLTKILSNACATVNGASPSVARAFMYFFMFLRVSF